MEKKKNIDKYPGYPPYPAKDDITMAGNNNGRQRIDAEPVPPEFNDTVDNRDKDTSIVKGTEADVTPDDIWALEATEQNMDADGTRNLVGSALDDTDNDGEPLNEDGSILRDASGSDLDVPGSSDDDADELIGEEDEENNYYSLGGDLHEGQEESKGD